MAELIAKALYSVILLSVAGFCVHEVWLAWFDSSVQYGVFAAAKDGDSADAAGNTFRRLIVQQQRRLLRLYQPENAASKAGEFRAPGDSVHIQSVSDLGDIPKSLLDDLKLEAAGVNVSSILTTLRRWVRPPNEITGSVDQIGTAFYVTANWPQAPRREGSGTEPRVFVLSPQSGLEPASFDVACRIFLARIAPADAVWKQVDDNDFCAFSRALAWFQEYVVSRNRALNDADRKTAREGPLGKARLEIDRLISGSTTLVYAYKLGGYIDIERIGEVPSSDADAAAKIKAILDQAETRFNEYLKRLSAIKPDARDGDAQERIAYLAARRAQPIDNAQVAANSRTFLDAYETAKSKPAAAAQASAAPGASVGPADQATAGTLCCFVKKKNDASGKTYFLTPAYLVGAVETRMVSPARIEQAESKDIGTVRKILGSVALVEVTSNVTVSNAPIVGLAGPVGEGDQLKLIGRTSKTASGKVKRINVPWPMPLADGPDARVPNTIVTDRMSAPGDGGAPVLDAQNKLVGMLFGTLAGIAPMSAESVVLPLKPILDAEDLELL